MLSQRNLPILMVVLLPSALAFAPLLSNTQRRGHSERSVVLDPLDITSSVQQIADHHPTLDALFSTLYTSAVKLQPAHGHSQSFFGPVDPYLSKLQSIAPSPNHPIAPTLIEDSAIPDQFRGAMEYARRSEFVDPTNVIRVDGAAPPGFTKPYSIWAEPQLQQRQMMSSQSTDRTLTVLNQEIMNLRALQKIPIAAFITVLVDFFLVTPGMDVYREEIDEDGDIINQEAMAAGAARVAVLAVVAGLTLTFS